MLALAASTLTAHAQSPADTLQDVRPFSTHALDLLAAREPGVEVISSPGAPGTTPTIHVRGVGVLPGIEPVYVVDGMRRRNLDGIAPESIEKIEVLKNAAAMGLWGPDAAAGVVVVTTRRASQQGFHAGYEFAGGFQSLTHAPEKMTLAEWQKHGRYTREYYDIDYRDPEQPAPEISVLQKHHLYTQYGGNKLSAYAGFSVLDNDGPYSGKVDTYRRYAASWSAEYRPLKWLSLETTGRWNQSSTSRAPEGWLKRYLISIPEYGEPYVHYLDSDRETLSETVVQGQISFYPLPGLYVRGIGGYAQGKNHPYKARWTDYVSDSDESPDKVEATAGYEGKKWFQWGVDAGWKGQWGGHRIHMDGTFRRVKEKQDNQILDGYAYLSLVGLGIGDDAHLEEKFLLPYYEKYKNADLEERLEMMHYNHAYAYPSNVSTPEMKWKEGSLSVGYDWKDRYKVDFSYFRLWSDKFLSGEGWRVPAVTLGWTLSEEPILRRILPESLKTWSVTASWSKTGDYIPILGDLSRWITVTSSLASSTAARHRDLTTALSFRFGGATMDLSASWYINDDDLTDHYSYIVDGLGIERHQESGKILIYTLRNQGVELSGTFRHDIGPFRYSISPYLTFYGNRVRFINRDSHHPIGESGLYMGYDSRYINWGTLQAADGERIGGSFAVHIPEDPAQISWDEEVWKGSVFPGMTGGVRASLGWNRWQLTVSGHGDRGQTVWFSGANDALIRHYLEEPPIDMQSDSFSYVLQKIARTDAGVFDASFFRIDQMRLDYTLPLLNARLNLFASLENWFLFTKYPGTDPELALAWKGLGKETATYPSTRRTIFGLSISF